MTKIIVEDSQLVGDVTCTATAIPCIQFAAPNMALRLNGFTITGPANPDDTTTCPLSGQADGINNGTNAATSQPGVHIIGPGMVQKFTRHGIFIVGRAGVSTNVTIKHVTSHHNCLSGLLATGMTDSVIEGIVSIRNAVNSGGGPCGGICLPGSHNNHIVNNLLGGNGSVCAAPLCAAAPTVASNNDFGVGLLGTSSGNLIEHNSITGNTNGILIQAGASGNTIRRNIVAGNPPSQVSRTYGPVGFDIKDGALTNGARNTFDGNWCITYSGPGPSPCPSFPAVVPPAISALTATPDVLWPPNGQMASVTIGVTVTDDTDPSPACEITSVTSNEPLGASDWSLIGPLSLNLRAERNGLGAGRVYSITVTCTNSSQLNSSAVGTVLVPHDLR
ncbi:MAG TPA: right-handed parallel beta-helix repeat-containing protein [Gemmatimonadales bacterium]|nr:right-handed parallel beta-helix repeat-containing protein [Gemmatimonadales bacterium]